jgi:hypothetical protein
MAKKAKDSSVPSGPGAVYQLKVTLDGIRPQIWRRIQVREDITLFKLHKILQVVMGWYDCHLHQFMISGETYSVISIEADMLGDDFIDEKKVKLNRVIPGEKFKFTYEYDFGDGWDHTILVEKIIRPLEELKVPVCLKGKRSAPPEDCGGEGGYYNLQRALKNPKHPEHEYLRTWAGDEYDPEYFDAEIVNERLTKIR